MGKTQKIYLNVPDLIEEKTVGFRKHSFQKQCINKDVAEYKSEKRSGQWTHLPSNPILPPACTVGYPWKLM